MAENLLQSILECNRSYLAGRGRFLPEQGEPFIVVACIDPRLTGILEPALGLPRHRAIVIRTAGNVVGPSAHDAVRSIAAAIFLKGGREVFLTGHTDCAMAAFSTSEVIESFRRRNIARSAFGEGDLRTWFGAFPDVRRNVLEGADWLRRSGIVPADVGVHGLLLDSADGKLEILTGAEAPSEARPAAPAPEAAKKGPPDVPPPPPAKPIVIEQGHKAPAVEAPSSMAEAVMTVRDFLVQERRDEHLRRSLAELKGLVGTERNPARIVSAIERMAADYRTRYPDLPAAVAYLKRGVEAKGTGGLQFMELIRRVLD